MDSPPGADKECISLPQQEKKAISGLGARAGFSVRPVFRQGLCVL